MFLYFLLYCVIIMILCIPFNSNFYFIRDKKCTCYLVLSDINIFFFVINLIIFCHLFLERTLFVPFTIFYVFCSLLLVINYAWIRNNLIFLNFYMYFVIIMILIMIYISNIYFYHVINAAGLSVLFVVNITFFFSTAFVACFLYLLYLVNSLTSKCLSFYEIYLGKYTILIHAEIQMPSYEVCMSNQQAFLCLYSKLDPNLFKIDFFTACVFVYYLNNDPESYGHYYKFKCIRNYYDYCIMCVTAMQSRYETKLQIFYTFLVNTLIMYYLLHTYLHYFYFNRDEVSSLFNPFNIILSINYFDSYVNNGNEN